MEEMEIDIDLSPIEEAAQKEKNELNQTYSHIGQYLDMLNGLLMENMYNPNRASQICKQAKKDLSRITNKFNAQYKKLYSHIELAIVLINANIEYLEKDKTEDQIYSDYKLRNKWQQQRELSAKWNNRKSLIEVMNQTVEQSMSMIDAIGNLTGRENLDDENDNQLED